MTEWSFLTNHARALICIERDPGIRLRDIAAALDVTERSAYAIVTELAAAGYVVKVKEGRRNRYEIQRDLPLRGVLGPERTIGEILDVLVEASTDGETRARSDKRAARGASLDPPGWRWIPQPQT